MNRYYVDRNCGRDIIRDRHNDNRFLTAHEIVEILNGQYDDATITDKREIHIYTDGSCNPSKRIGGWAIVSNEITANGSKKNTTNNEMELYSILKAIEYADQYGYTDVHIYTDSEYAFKTLTEWAYKWESKNWRKRGGDIMNLDLIKTIFYRVKDDDKYVFHKVKAHSGVKHNEMADKMAKSCYDLP